MNSGVISSQTKKTLKFLKTLWCWKILTLISGRLPAGNVLIFPQTVVGAGYKKVRVM